MGYDWVLPPQVTPIAFADDLALVITHADPFILQTGTNHSLAMIDHWMQPRGPCMSPAKSVEIFLNGRKRTPHVSVTLNGCLIPIRSTARSTARYLGYILDSGLTSKPHLLQAAAKAQKMAMAVSRILPHARGASDSRRRVLSSEVDSILLYATPIWGPAAQKGYVRRILDKTQRTAAIRVARENRTVSAAALRVLSHSLPYDLRIKEQTARYAHTEWTRRQEERIDDSEPQLIPREHLVAESRWEAITERCPGYWTRTLLPDISKSMDATHGSSTYPLSQFLTGHGSFMSYLHMIGKVPFNLCLSSSIHPTARAA